ncbi:hypothetical protein MD588_10440 [Photobacterium sp. SDRW27]|uniref:SecDF P1 head subdomain-containing protein n=1 Tax=Photobacterium obscurum TaxID=2829490 RepID=UPI002244D3A5|nr:hypothetical protein [Photobacterium obscurum]MCW8329225.1 hypothetical protein [Photobacterium obscurum]
MKNTNKSLKPLLYALLSTVIVAAASSAYAGSYYIDSTLSQDGKTLESHSFNMTEQSSKTFFLNDKESVRYSLQEEDEGAVYIDVTLIETIGEAKSSFTLPGMLIMPSGESNGVTFQADEKTPLYDWQVSAEPSLAVSLYQQAKPGDGGLVFNNDNSPIYFDKAPIIDSNDFLYIRYCEGATRCLETELTAIGAEKLKQHTRGNVNQWLAIAVDGSIVNAVQIRSEIGSKIQISLPDQP